MTASLIILLLTFSVSLPDWVAEHIHIDPNDKNVVVVVFLVQLEGCASCVVEPIRIKSVIESMHEKSPTIKRHYLTLVKCNRVKDVKYIANRTQAFGLLIPDINGKRTKELTDGNLGVSAIVYCNGKSVLVRKLSDLDDLSP